MIGLAFHGQGPMPDASHKTLNGADVGDLYMSLIHTCELNKVNPFDYLTELQRHTDDLAAQPADWMPWKYRETLVPTVSGSCL